MRNCAPWCRVIWAPIRRRVMFDGEDIRRWIMARAGSWRASVNNVATLRSQRQATVDEALNAVEAYRGLARDLATARRGGPNSPTTPGLESLYRQIHTLISRRPPGGWENLQTTLRFHNPQVTAGIAGSIPS